MTILRFLFGNWTLKIGAILLAVILYVGMIALQNTQVFPGQISIDVIHQPETAVLISPKQLPQVGGIRYIAPPDVRISTNSFRATIDLTNVKVGAGENALVKVQLVAEDSRIQIVDYQPQQIRVTLDPIQSRLVDVKVDTGTIPVGLSLGPQTVSVSQVTATGAASDVARVAKAQALVRIDASGLDIDEDFPLIPVDSAGIRVDGITLNPSSVHVRIQVGSQLRTETVPVNPVLQGTPAAGYYITAIEVRPPLVTVSGEADALAQIKALVNTAPISVAGATGDVTVKVALSLPAGVESPGTTTVTVVVHLATPASTRTVTIGIVPDGARPDRIYSLSTPNTIITIGGATAALNAFDTSTLVGIVSVGNLDAGTHTVKIVITLPSGIKLVAMSPASITVTVTVSPSPPPPTPSPT
jgi:YbbR domain-containing protein